MSTATTAIQTALMTPRAKSDAMRAQQQPTHQAPFLIPMRNAPDHPSRQDPEAGRADCGTSTGRRSSTGSARIPPRPGASLPSGCDPRRPTRGRGAAGLPRARRQRRRRLPRRSTWPDSRHEHHGRQPVPAHPGEQRHRRGHRWEHHRRHHDNPHTDEPAERPQTVHGPLSIPRISWIVHHHPTPASAKRTTTNVR